MYDVPALPNDRSLVSPFETEAARPSVILVGGEAGSFGRLRGMLSCHAYHVDHVHTASEFRTRLSAVAYDVVVLSTTLPDADGLTVLTWLTSVEHQPAILVRSETCDEIDRIVALELGADDCVAKSCNLGEIKARVRSMLRRRLNEQRRHANAFENAQDSRTVTNFQFAGWTLHGDSRLLITPTGDALDITKSEYLILSCLLNDPGSVKGRASLGSPDVDLSTEDFRSIDVFVSRLRKKLSRYGGDKLIQTVRGKGYRLTALVEPFSSVGAKTTSF